jgi:hypothetical protein
MKFKTTEELKHVPFEMYARVLARAEQAEKRVGELEAKVKEADYWWNQIKVESPQRLARAEQAEAQLVVAREAAVAALKDLEYFSRREGPGGDPSRFASIYKLRAALQQTAPASATSPISRSTPPTDDLV